MVSVVSLNMKNRLHYKIAITLILGIISSGCAITDSRLSGKWRSDLELTTKFNEKHAILTERQKKVFSQLFGKMELTYSRRGQCEVFLPGGKIDTGSRVIESDESKRLSEYKILYKNDNAIVVLNEEALFGESISTLHFVDEDTYWIYVGESEFVNLHIREYFTKVK